MSNKPLPAIFEGKEIISQRVGLYKDGKHAALSTAMKQTDASREDTRWVWYSKEHIETWLEEINDLGADGMRIYFGVKEVDTGDELDLAAQAASAAGQLCLLMILTREGSNEDSHVNIIYEAEPDFESRKNLYEERKLKGNARQFNFGGYCPPMSITEGDDFPIVSIS